LAAILGGGVFGDHCSPISDTTAVSSLAAGCDLLTHVKTQLPYALVAGGMSIVAFTAASFVMI
jgi:Na+/H+ antiporter NhaC